MNDTLYAREEMLEDVLKAEYRYAGKTLTSDLVGLNNAFKRMIAHFSDKKELMSRWKNGTDKEKMTLWKAVVDHYYETCTVRELRKRHEEVCAAKYIGKTK